MDQQVYSDTVNRIGNAEVTLWAIWHDNVLVGVAPAGGVNVKRWLKVNEIIEIDGRRWVLFELIHRREAGTVMAHLLAIE